MKVLLLQDIKNIGRRGEVKDFPDGYVMNFLLPKKLAEVATKEKIQNIEISKKQKSEINTLKKDLLLKDILELDSKTVEVIKKINSSGTLFDKIDKKDISDLIYQNFHKKISTDFIIIDEPIKSTGQYSVKIKGDKSIKKDSILNLIIKGQ
jgi:large subunit ribosomal protein L9